MLINVFEENNTSLVTNLVDIMRIILEEPKETLTTHLTIILNLIKTATIIGLHKYYTSNI